MHIPPLHTMDTQESESHNVSESLLPPSNIPDVDLVMPPPLPRKPRKSRAKPKIEKENEPKPVVQDEPEEPTHVEQPTWPTLEDELKGAAEEQEREDQKDMYAEMEVHYTYEPYRGEHEDREVVYFEKPPEPDFLTFMVGWVSGAVLPVGAYLLFLAVK